MALRRSELSADARRVPELSTSVRESFRRPLRIFPFDPVFDRLHDPIVCTVPCELLEAGPSGRLVDVVDFDVSTGHWHSPVDLNSAEALIGQGLAPSETDLQSHQQMVYAVAMRVLETFERGLGRPFGWTDRLKVLPHYANDRDCYADPKTFSVLLGYFTANQSDPIGGSLAGQRVFAALSYDVVAHEVCHPVLSRLRPTDTLNAPEFYEACAIHHSVGDLIAILVRFSEPEVIARTIRVHGADLRGTPMLKIAAQFGRAAANSDWVRTFPQQADISRYQNERAPKRLGDLLSSAVLEGFLSAYEDQVADLLRLNGGPPTAGNVHPDLVGRLASEAAFVASRVTRSLIAAIDYLPPFKLTLYDVLRAVLATDNMFFGAATKNYRAALVQAFHKRGLIPRDPGSLAVEALMLNPRARGPKQPVPRAADLLLHAVTAAEYRRQYAEQAFGRRSARLDELAAAMREHQQEQEDIGSAIAQWACNNISKLPLNKTRAVRVASMHGCSQVDSSGSLGARVFVTLVQDRVEDEDQDARPPQGVTLVCDSDGHTLYVIGGNDERRVEQNEAAEPAAEHAEFVARLIAQWPGTAERGERLPASDRQDIDRRSWRRPLRVIPFDPMVDRAGRSVIADVAYETVEAGPSGRLVEVIDYDPVQQCWYEPISLDDPGVLVDSGLDVAETDPRFHQQMVYAVAMRVLETFERGLGRPLRWRGQRRLTVYPHAFLGQNAYFDEKLFALMFGYFTASLDDPGPNLPGQVVFTALSHDIIAHETTHAVLHRLRRRYSEPTNPDVLAFHEGFADIVAILQHFTYREVVAEHLAATRADLTDRSNNAASPLLDLASQFGHATGDGGPLRQGLVEPDKQAYSSTVEEHDRGAILVAAVIDGFLRSYRDCTADLLRIATAGTGVLQPGALHPDLVNRVASSACLTAERVTQICIRAFDYLPPVDVTFSDYLRALVTADFELFPDDGIGLRANLIEGFRVRGIYPSGVASLADQSLRIPRQDASQFGSLPGVRERLLDTVHEFDRQRRSRTELLAVPSDAMDSALGNPDAEWGSPRDREKWFRALHAWGVEHYDALRLAEPDERLWPIAIDGFFTSQRIGADGYLHSQITVQFVQRDKRSWPDLGGLVPTGGATVVADGEGQVRYVISKPLPSADETRMAELRDHVASLEHRLTSVAWNSNPKKRIVDRLNLRTIDGAP